MNLLQKLFKKKSKDFFEVKPAVPKSEEPVPPGKIRIQDAMKLNRAGRRAIGKRNGGIKIPSIDNVYGKKN